MFNGLYELFPFVFLAPLLCWQAVQTEAGLRCPLKSAAFLHDYPYSFVMPAYVLNQAYQSEIHNNSIDMFLNCMEWERKVKLFSIHDRSISSRDSCWILCLLTWLLILFPACAFFLICDAVSACNWVCWDSSVVDMGADALCSLCLFSCTWCSICLELALPSSTGYVPPVFVIHVVYALHQSNSVNQVSVSISSLLITEHNTTHSFFI